MRFFLPVLIIISALAHAECDKVVLSTHPDYPPFHWNQDGKLVGASIDQAKIIFGELDIPFEAKYSGPWKRVLYKAQKGQIDLILGLKNVPERHHYLAYTKAPYYQNPVAVFVAQSRSFVFNNWNDLIGRKGTLSTGDRHGEPFDTFLKNHLTVERINELKINFDLLVKGRTEYFITGLYTGRAFLAKYPDKDKITHLPNPVVVSPIHHAFSKRSDCQSLITHFNARLEEMNHDGVTAQLIENNLKKWKAQTTSQFEKTSLNIGLLLASKGQGKGYRELFSVFENEHPHISINFSVYDDETYKQKVQEWVKNRKGPDVFYWQAGQRLFSLIDQDAIRPLDFLRETEHWDDLFPSQILKQLERDGYIYGLPFSYYHWGFYYKKSLFKRLNLEEPKKWGEFLNVASTLSENDLDAFTIGTKYHWPAAAWFDFLNLRLNGLPFYRALLEGSVSYHDPKVIKVMEIWKHLVDQGYFNKDHKQLTWSEAIPDLLHEKAGLTLIGNFVEKRFSPKVKEDIGYFPFPVLDTEVPRYELMPTEVFVLSRWNTKLSESLTLLRFLSKHETQQTLADQIGYLPATQKVSLSTKPIELEVKELLSKTEGVMQYFDRDTDQRFSQVATRILSDFLVNPNIEQTVSELENERLKNR